MKRNISIVKIRVLLYLLLLALVYSSKSADLHRLINDTQKMSSEGGDMRLVWWIPTEYWDESLKSSKSVTDYQREQIHKALDDYSVFAVAAVKIGAFGGLTPVGREQLLENVEFKVGANVLKPLPKGTLSNDAESFIELMKPMLAGMLGQFGKSLEFVLYKNKQTGKKLISAASKGAFDFKFYDESYHWKLPIPSLLPDKVDAETREVFPGDYVFNPYTGKRLPEK